MNRLYLDRLANLCVCAADWKPLVVVHDGEWKLRCSEFGEDHDYAGVWLKSSVDRRRLEAHMEASDVRRIYAGTVWGDMMGIPRPIKQTPDQVLARGKALLGRDNSGIF